MSRSTTKRVTVLLRRAPRHPQTSHGLRAALGYTTVGLQVRVVLLGEASQLLASPDELPKTLQRGLATLRAIGCPITACSDGDELLDICNNSDVVVCW